jgi:hypothetical protein
MKKLFVAIFILSPVLFFAIPTHAQTEYRLLEPLPGYVEETSPGKTNASNYISGIFTLLIAIAGGLAVLMIIFGGIKYMSTDAFMEKNEAKNIIENAIWGFVLAISAWLILKTINPKLVQEININIPVQKIESSADSAKLVSGAGIAGCQGNCQFSYVNYFGTTIKYRECVSCSAATTFDLEIKQKTVNGTPTQINTSLGNRLVAVQNITGNPSFVVTEAWPPTVNHLSQNQYDGTAVDISLSSPSATNINLFVKNANDKGLSAVYEVATQAQKQKYINAGVNPSNIIVANITGEHFSVK